MQGCQEERWNGWTPISKTQKQTPEGSVTDITLFPEEQRDSTVRLAHSRATCGSAPVGWISRFPSKTKTAPVHSCCQGYCCLSLSSPPKDWRRRHNCFETSTAFASGYCSPSHLSRARHQGVEWGEGAVIGTGWRTNIELHISRPKHKSTRNYRSPPTCT